MRVESPVLPPVLVPRFSEPIPGGPTNPLMPYQQMPEPSMPHNMSYSQNGFASPPHINTGGPLSPGMSSGGLPSPSSSINSPPPSGMQVSNKAQRKIEDLYIILDNDPTKV